MAVINGDDDRNQLNGSEDADVIHAFGDDDLIYGNGGADEIYGGDGDDTMHGGAGADTLDGGDGFDRFFVTDVSEIVAGERWIGGGDTDIIIMRGDANAQTYLGDLSLVDISGIELFEAEACTFSIAPAQCAFISLMTYTVTNFTAGGAATFEGSTVNRYDLFACTFNLNDAGNDLTLGSIHAATVNGGAGDDRIQVTSVANFAFGVGGSFFGNGGDDYISGSTWRDTIVGGAANDTLYGGAESDNLIGGEGDDELHGDDGFDFADYSDATGPIMVDLTIATPQDTGGAGVDLLDSIEALLGSAFADRLVASDVGCRLIGNGGDDTLIGGAGADVFIGGDQIRRAGIDSIFGGGGDDTIYGSQADVGADGDDTIDGGEGVDTVYAEDLSQVTSSNIERLISGNDLTLRPDQVAGLTYINVSSVSSIVARITLSGPGFADFAGVEMEKLYRAYEIDLSDAGNSVSLQGATLGFKTFAASVVGGLGSDTVVGGTTLGARLTIDGGGGDDVLTAGGMAGQRNSVDGGAGNDTITGLDWKDYLSGGADDDSIMGAGGVDQLDGGAGNDTLLGGADVDLLIGGTGADSLDGGAGRDAMRGGAGDDSYVVETIGDKVYEYAGEGTDSVLASVAFRLTNTVENLTLSEAGGAINGIGSNTANVLTGNSFGNVLSSLGLDDTVHGGAGADRIDGGAGNDQLYGDGDNDLFISSTGADAYDGGDGIDTISFQAGGAANVYLDGSGVNGGAAVGDTFASVENVVGSATKIDILVGDGMANKLQGLGANDQLSGRGGADVLLGGDGNDKLTGGLGADRLQGDAGADTFVYLALDDSTTASTGRDLILDFHSAEGDRIDLSAIDANANLANDQAFAFIGTAAFSGVAGELRTVAQNGALYVYGDVDGDAKADFTIALANVASLQATDFVL